MQPYLDEKSAPSLELKGRKQSQKSKRLVDVPVISVVVESTMPQSSTQEGVAVVHTNWMHRKKD